MAMTPARHKRTGSRHGVEDLGPRHGDGSPAHGADPLALEPQADAVRVVYVPARPQAPAPAPARVRKPRLADRAQIHVAVARLRAPLAGPTRLMRDGDDDVVLVLVQQRFLLPCRGRNAAALRASRAILAMAHSTYDGAEHHETREYA